MSQATPALAATPLVPKLGPRIDSLDLLRGIAILGIFLMNTQSQMLWWQAYMNPDLTVGDQYGDFYKAVNPQNVSTLTSFLTSIFGTHLNAAAYIFTHIFADMKFITIFSFMFGAGIMLQGERVQSRGMSPWAIHYKRMAVLLCIALFHAYVIWYGDILTTYAMAGILLFPLRRIKPGLLICIGALFVSTTLLVTFAKYSGTSLNSAMGYAPSSEQTGPLHDYSHVFPLDRLESLSARLWSHATVTDSNGQQVQLSEPEAFQGQRYGWVPNTPGEEADPDADEGSGHYGPIPVYWSSEIKYRTVSSISSQTAYFWEEEFWRCGGCMLIGMALHRLRFFHGQWTTGAYIAIAAFCIPVGMAVTGLGIIVNDHLFHWDIFLLNKIGTSFNYIGSFIQAFGYMSVGVLVAIRVAAPAAGRLSRWFTTALSWAVKPVRAVGKMALTNYLFQNIVGTTLAYAHRVPIGGRDVKFGLAWYGHIERYQLLYIVPFVWAAQLVLSAIWMRCFRQGPVEWAWHKLVYWGAEFPLRPAEEPPTVNGPAGTPAC